VRREVGVCVFRTASFLAYASCLLIASAIFSVHLVGRWLGWENAPLMALRERAVANVRGIPVTAVLGPEPVTHGIIGFQGAGGEDTGPAAAVVAQALKAYPSSFSPLGRLRCVRFCTNLTSDGVPCASVASFDEMCAYIDVSRFVGLAGRLELNIHHEIYHLLESEWFADGRDLSWESLNDRNFRYGPAAAVMQSDPDAGIPNDKLSGFLNRYSTSDAREDRAEVFSFMMSRPDYLATRLKSDIVLGAKVRRITELLGALTSELGPPYWQARGLDVQAVGPPRAVQGSPTGQP
jgi:hypothetical protein